MLGVVDSVAVAYAKPDETTDIAVPMFTPKAPGEYKSTWQMVDPQGEAFGQPVVVKILVEAAPTATPSPTTEVGSTPVPDGTPGPVIRFWADDETIDAGDSTLLHVVTEDVAAVWLDGDIVIGGREVREVAPCSSANYTLDVQLRDGKHVYRNIVVDVVGTCSNQDHPDLSVEYVLEPAQLSVGQTGVISYTVTNLGDGPAADVCVTFDPGLSAAGALTVVENLRLDAGYGMRATYTHTWPISGVFQTMLKVDDGSGTVENGHENWMSRVVVVGAD
jgi:hypothetical protein